MLILFKNNLMIVTKTTTKSSYIFQYCKACKTSSRNAPDIQYTKSPRATFLKCIFSLRTKTTTTTICPNETLDFARTHIPDQRTPSVSFLLLFFIFLIATEENLGAFALRVDNEPLWGRVETLVKGGGGHDPESNYYYDALLNPFLFSPGRACLPFCFWTI